ncbi:ankyrin repeat-containing domain protein [Mycena sp. CBHHK59/15]|nr:ankyrin repeat-containing domain protein [Mycena sp. CBHHK59/15]
MPPDYFEQLPPELISLFPPSLSNSSLNALALTCWRLHEILQSELDTHITPAFGRELLLWVAASKSHIVKKLVLLPCLIHPSNGYGFYSKSPLHAAVELGNVEIAAPLLKAGADPDLEWNQDETRPIHIAAMHRDLEMMRLLLDHGAELDAQFGCYGCSETALHFACSVGHLEMIELLFERGASIDCNGHYRPTLGFAVHSRKLDVVRLLLAKGAATNIIVPLFALLDGGPVLLHQADLLYIVMQLTHPRDKQETELLKQM